nr:distal membrane-arm assembly complex protein 2 [Megalopta genalis]
MLCQVQRSTQMITKFLGNIKSHNKLHVNIVRNFYNSSGAVNFFLRNIRKRRNDFSNIVYKRYEDDDDTETTVTIKSILFPNEPPAKHHFLQFYFSDFWAHMKKEYIKYTGKKLYNDNLMLGAEIACALFILRNKGRVKIYNNDEWIEKTERYKKPDLIPDFHDPDFILEAIDLKGYPILYENIENICNLLQLRWLNLGGCSTIDDWTVDKISAEFPAVEHLDISDCINVSPKGLQALYKMPNLKKLIVTDFQNSTELELTCLMLEDINPYLKCEIIKVEMELLEDN